MSSVIAIRSAFETRLKAIANPLATQWENTKYDPKGGTPYQRCTLMFAEPVNPEWGNFVQEVGYLQIDLRFPNNVGAGDAMAYAQKIRDWFPKRLCLVSGVSTVTVERTPFISNGSNDGDRFVVVVKIRFWSNTAS